MARILVVDDESGIIFVLKAMLTSLGYEVLTAADGREALNKISSEKLDLVVTDVVMPNIDGLQLIREIQKTRPAIKIIAMSGGSIRSGPDGYLSNAKNLGAVRCLSKPFLLNELASSVEELLAE